MAPNKEVVYHDVSDGNWIITNQNRKKKGNTAPKGHRVNRCLSMMYLRVCVCVECVCPWQMVQMLPISHPSAAMTQLHHTNPVGERHRNHEDHQNISATSSGCKFQIVQWHVAASRPPQPPMVKNGAHLPESLQRKWSLKSTIHENDGHGWHTWSRNRLDMVVISSLKFIHLTCRRWKIISKAHTPWT